MDARVIRLRMYRWSGMLEWRWGGVRYRISLLFPALITALLLCQLNGLTVSCLLASIIHEGGHLLAMLIIGAPPRECTLGAFGMRICLGNTLMDYKRNLLVSLAGPCANGIAAVVLWVMHCATAASVHVALALLNLLPAKALDGGEIVRCMFALLGWETKTEWVLRITSLLMVAPMIVLGVGVLVDSGNPTLVLVGVYLTTVSIFLKKSEKSS